MQTERSIEHREAQFWDSVAATCDEPYIVRIDLLPPVHRRKLALIGEVRGARVLDLGCGTGDWSVILALLGAEVWAMDISKASVAATLRLAAHNGVAGRVHTSQMSGYQLGYADASFDLIHGQDILHHLQPAMGRELRRVLRAGGRAIFLENSANNPLLMAARRLCGRFGIPRWSSDDEHPLRSDEIAAYGGAFGARAQVSYPVFLFFALLDMKLARYRSPALSRLCAAIDEGVWRLAPPLRRYSYRQIVSFEAPL